MTDLPEKTEAQARLERFMFPLSPYRGKFSPEALLLNANLQEFAGRVALICALETGGNLEPKEAYEKIQALWKELQRTKSLLESPPT